MEKLTTLTAVAAPLPIDNCDTDQIMPKQFLRGIDKSGLARGVFFNMRCNPDGSPRADCVFNRPGFEKTAIPSGSQLLKQTAIIAKRSVCNQKS